MSATEVLLPPVRWLYACRRSDIVANTGAAALVGGRQVALFRLLDPHTGEEHIHALDNIDPFSGAAVLARGLLGDAAGEPYVASPMYKQRFALRDGRCLDDAGVAVHVHAVRVVDDWILIGRTAAAAAVVAGGAGGARAADPDIVTRAGAGTAAGQARVDPTDPACACGRT